MPDRVWSLQYWRAWPGVGEQEGGVGRVADTLELDNSLLEELPAEGEKVLGPGHGGGGKGRLLDLISCGCLMIQSLSSSVVYLSISRAMPASPLRAVLYSSW